MLASQRAGLESNGKSRKGLSRFEQERIGRPIADKIYRATFGNRVEISRERGSLLDKEHAIDVNIKFPNGMILTCQEKFLSYEYAHRATVTIEYWQNPRTAEQGDWFKLASQLYFVGYFTKDGTDFAPWVILNWPMVVWSTNNSVIQWREQGNNLSNARATFQYTGIRNIPESCIIAKYSTPSTTTATGGKE